MKFVLISILFVVSLFSQDRLLDFVKAYEAKDMSLACSLGRKLYRADIRDENILIATGHACAEDDFIDFIGVLQQRLGQSSKVYLEK
ncbi:MAG TPA: hypothetical protein EYO73_01560, partial [Sulfurimonas sp.]|nr:hypothetical protein [Sulfurimonas sp.]